MFKGTLLPDKWGHQAAGHEAKSGGAGAAATALRLAWLAAVRRPLPLIAHMHAEALATHPPTPLRHPAGLKVCCAPCKRFRAQVSKFGSSRS